MAPLSEHEKRQLRLLEAQLHAEDPKFVKTMRTKQSISLWRRPKLRNAMLAAVGVVLGITGMIIGVVLPTLFVGISIIGVLTFTIGVFAALWIFQDETISIPRVKTRNFMANLESRWDERKRNNL